MTSTTNSMAPGPSTRTMLNKVPEVVIWFWIIKVLCTTVGESFADWINQTLGVGLVNTSLIFTVVLAAVLFVQMRLPRYVPFAYWLTVVVLSVTGTLYTDILTDQLHVPLALSTSVFAVAAGGRVRHLVLPGADPVDPQHRHDCRGRRSTGSPCW